MPRIRDKDVERARAEARFEKAEARAREAGKVNAEDDAARVARDANTDRLKALRLEKEQADRETAQLKRLDGTG